MNMNRRNQVFRIIFTSTIILLFAFMFWPFFTPILLAGLLAFALENLVSRFAVKWRSRNRATLALLTLLFLFVTGPIVMTALKLVSTVKEYSSVGIQNTQLYKLTEQLLTSISQKVDSIGKSFDLDMSQLPQLSSLMGRGSEKAAEIATALISQIPDWGLSIVVFFLALYYFLMEASEIKKFFLHFDLVTRKELNQLIKIVKESSYLTLVASVLIGCVQALTVALFAYFCGFTEFLVIFVLTFLFSLIPVIGAAPVALFLSALAFIQGHTGVAIVMIVASVIAGSIDNIIKPLIVNSSADDVHPVISLMALIGAIMVYGFPGILLGPILTQLAFNIITILFPPEKIGEQTTE